MSDKSKDNLKDNVMRFEFPEGVINPLVFSTPESKDGWKEEIIETTIYPDIANDNFTFAHFVFKMHEGLQRAIDSGLYNIRISECYVNQDHGILVVKICGERQETKFETEERIKEDLFYYRSKKANTLESLHRQEESIKKLEKCLEDLALKNENR